MRVSESFNSGKYLKTEDLRGTTTVTIRGW